MKTQTYQQIRNGGAASRKDLIDLLKIPLEHPEEPMATVLFEATGISPGDPRALDLLFDAVVEPIDNTDHMKTGGRMLYEILPASWRDIAQYVSAADQPGDTDRIADWIETVAGRQLAGDDSLNDHAARKVFRETFGEDTPNLKRQYSEWQLTQPWSVVYSGIRTRTAMGFSCTGASVVLPVTERAYFDLRSGNRNYNDVRPDELSPPGRYVYLAGTCEISWLNSSRDTLATLIATMCQIAAMTADEHFKVLSPAPIPLSQKRLLDAGFHQVGISLANDREVPVFEATPDWRQRWIIHMLRWQLQEQGFAKFPPRQ